jgi:hypothetical protein
MVFNRLFERKLPKLAVFLAMIVGMIFGGLIGTLASEGSIERFNSYNHISENQIKVFDEKVFIEIPDKELRWSNFEDSGSMNPLFDEGHNGLEFVPESVSDIHVGDIISFDYFGETYVHRVVEIGNDGEWFALTKGDANNFVDEGKRRFKDIKGIMFGVVF